MSDTTICVVVGLAAGFLSGYLCAFGIIMRWARKHSTHELLRLLFIL